MDETIKIITSKDQRVGFVTLLSGDEVVGEYNLSKTPRIGGQTIDGKVITAAKLNPKDAADLRDFALNKDIEAFALQAAMTMKGIREEIEAGKGVIPPSFWESLEKNVQQYISLGDFLKDRAIEDRNIDAIVMIASIVTSFDFLKMTVDSFKKVTDASHTGTVH